MTEKRFIFDRDTVATNIKMPIVFDNEQMNIGEVLNKLNELYDENEELKKENRNLRFEMSMYEQKIEELEKELKSE